MNWPLPPVYNLAQALERLSPGAQRKHEQLQAELSDAVALVQTALERVKRQETRCGQVARRRDFAANARDAAATAELDGELQAAVASLDKARRELDARNGVRANAEQTVSRINNFITSLLSGLSDLQPPPPPGRLPPLQREGESIPDALARIRSEIGAAGNERAKVLSAPLPVKEIRDQITRQVDAMARAGAPRIVMKTAVEVAIAWPDLPPPGVAMTEPVYAPGAASRIAAWLHADKIKAELIADLPLDGPNVIPNAARPARLLELEGKIHTLEIVEEKLILLAQAANLDVQRRVNASPWAILFTADEDVAVEAAE